MSRDLEQLKVDIFKGQQFSLAFDNPDSSYSKRKGTFVEVAEAYAPSIVMYEQQLGLLTIVKRAILGNAHSVVLQERNNESLEYVAPFSVVKKEYLEAAETLYYQRMPATVWLFLKTGLAKPEQMNVPDLATVSKFIGLMYAEEHPDIGGDDFDGPGT